MSDMPLLETELQRKVDEFQTIFDSMPVMIWYKDTHNRIVRVNRAAAEFEGTLPEALEGKTCEELYPPEQAAAFFEDDLEVITSGKPKLGIVEQHRIPATGEIQWLQTSKVPCRDQSGNVTSVVAIAVDITERKRADNEAAKERQLLRTLVDNLPDSIFFKDRQSRFVLNNRKHLQILGKETQAEVLGKTDFDFFSNELALQYYQDEQALMNAGVSLMNREEPTRDEQGNTSWSLTSKVPLRDEEGQVIGFVGISRDVTDRKRADEALAQSREMLQLVMNTIPQSICWKDRNSVYLGCNRRFAEDLKLSDTEWIVGKTDYDLASAEHAEHYQNIDRRVMDADTPELNFEEPQPRPDGTLAWLRTSKAPLHDTNDDVMGVLVMYEDITGRKRIEQELAQSREMLRLVMNTIPQSIFWKDRNSVFLGCNRKLAEDLKLSNTDAIVGKTDFDFSPVEQAKAYQSLDRHVMDADKAHLNFEEPQPRPDGTLAWLSTSKVPLHDPNDEVVGVLVMYEDITKRKLEEQERERMYKELKIANDKAIESSRLKSEFLATMSHELRTPLNAIIGFSGIMLEGMAGQIDDTARHMIQGTYDSSHNLLKLINDVLDLSKIEAGRMELVIAPLSVPVLMREWQSQMNVIAQRKGVPLEVELSPNIPELYGDAEHIRQIVVNLLSNAFKFTEKGKVRLEVNWDHMGLTMRVQDTGIGIPPHALNYIFDEFRQVDSSSQRVYGGTGLGLAIVRRLCVMMGGGIQVSSKLGEGSVFTVNLPLQPVVELQSQS